jgi:hypothetical protein
MTFSRERGGSDEEERLRLDELRKVVGNVIVELAHKEPPV